MLKENSFNAIGVDINDAVVEKCAEKELEVGREDMLEYLQGLPDSVVVAVTGFHLI